MTHPSRPRPGRRTLISLLWCVVVIETGLLLWLGQRPEGQFWERVPVAASPRGVIERAPTTVPGSDAVASSGAPRQPSSAVDAPRVSPDQHAGEPTRHPPAETAAAAVPDRADEPVQDTRATVEETPAYHRERALHHARAQQWDEAIAHWHRVFDLEPGSQPDHVTAYVAAVLQASASARATGQRAEDHERLLDAVAWVPEHGDLRLRLAESFAARGEYSDAMQQYEAAWPLLPAQATELTTAMVRTYQDWGRGLLRQGLFGEAARLFRAALQLDSTSSELYVALGQAEFRRRAFSAALEAFDAALLYDPSLYAELEPYLTKAQGLQAGPQTVVIDFPPGATRIEVPVLIDGRLEVSFIVDTGATTTLLPAWAATRLGYRTPASTDWVRVQTAGGLRRLPYAAVNRLDIQGLGLSYLPVIIGDLPGSDGSRGLLGMDFLRYFALVVDHDVGRMTLRPR